MNTELWDRFDMLPRGTSVLVAVSGGPDSMCLMHLLLHRREELGLKLFAAHFEHGLRGEESLRDADFVASWCREHGVPCETEHGELRALADRQGLGLEAIAREKRYDFLFRTAERLGCDRIATAHNADDNAETLLLHLLRGSGTQGLGGIPPRRGRLVRPLLGVTRQEIETYLKENEVPFVLDSSNEDERFTRNRLRRQVMPVLRELNPRFSDAALRSSLLLREDESCLNALAEDFLSPYLEKGEIPLSKLRALPAAVSSRVLRSLGEKTLSREQTEQALRFLQSTEAGLLRLPGLCLRREQGRLFWREEEFTPLRPRLLQPGRPLRLEEAGLTLFSEISAFEGREIHSEFKTLCLKCENINSAITVSGRRAGDRLRVAGRGCTKTVRQLFSEAGYTQRERALCPVFRDEAGVLAVWGLALDERVAPQKGDLVLKLWVNGEEK